MVCSPLIAESQLRVDTVSYPVTPQLRLNWWDAPGHRFCGMGGGIWRNDTRGQSDTLLVLPHKLRMARYATTIRLERPQQGGGGVCVVAGNDTLRVTMTSHVDMGAFEGRSIEVQLGISRTGSRDTVLILADREYDDIPRRFSICTTYDSGVWSVYADELKGKHMTDPAWRSERGVQGELTAVGYTCAPGAVLTPLHGRVTGDIVALERLCTKYCEDTVALQEAMTPVGEDALVGKWKYFEREMDEEWLKLGGSYELAIISADEPGEYNILFLASEEARKYGWHSGMLKGYLRPLPAGVGWELSWFDINGVLMSKHQKVVLEDYRTLALHFPHHSSVLRFRRR